MLERMTTLRIQILIYSYDGLAGLNHVQTNSIIENSFKSEDFLVSSEWKRYSFTFTTGEVNYPEHNYDLHGTNSNRTAHPRFGVTLPKGVNDPIWENIHLGPSVREILQTHNVCIK